jgi:hypothetical protein
MIDRRIPIPDEKIMPGSHIIHATVPRRATSLVLASLDIGRVLADRDGVTVRALGTCMYPVVRPGDVLRMQSRSAADVVVGDIAICRGQGFLFGHRVIAKGVRDGRPFILTRPDRARGGSDVPTFDENLLGVVIAIERNGKRVPFQPRAYPWFMRRTYAARRALIEAGPRARLWIVDVLARVQSRAWYGNMARRWFVLTRPSTAYTIRLPMNATLGDAVYRQLEPREFDARTTWQGRAVERWTLALHLNRARETAAWATFALCADNTWRVEESHVRLRYCAMGLHELLLRQAEAILAKGGYQVSVDGNRQP